MRHVEELADAAHACGANMLGHEAHVVTMHRLRKSARSTTDSSSAHRAPMQRGCLAFRQVAEAVEGGGPLCVCVRVRVCARACVCVCACVCVHAGGWVRGRVTVGVLTHMTHIGVKEILT